MKKLLQLIGILALVVSGSWVSATTAEAYGRTITNPATNSTLSSAVMRAELQALEDELTLLGSAYPFQIGRAHV